MEVDIFTPQVGPPTLHQSAINLLFKMIDVLEPDAQSVDSNSSGDTGILEPTHLVPIDKERQYEPGRECSLPSLANLYRITPVYLSNRDSTSSIITVNHTPFGYAEYATDTEACTTLSRPMSDTYTSNKSAQYSASYTTQATHAGFISAPSVTSKTSNEVTGNDVERFRLIAPKNRDHLNDEIHTQAERIKYHLRTKRKDDYFFLALTQALRELAHESSDYLEQLRLHYEGDAQTCLRSGSDPQVTEAVKLLLPKSYGNVQALNGFAEAMLYQHYVEGVQGITHAKILRRLEVWQRRDSVQNTAHKIGSSIASEGSTIPCATMTPDEFDQRHEVHNKHKIKLRQKRGRRLRRADQLNHSIPRLQSDRKFDQLPRLQDHQSEYRVWS